MTENGDVRITSPGQIVFQAAEGVMTTDKSGNTVPLPAGPKGDQVRTHAVCVSGRHVPPTRAVFVGGRDARGIIMLDKVHLELSLPYPLPFFREQQVQQVS